MAENSPTNLESFKAKLDKSDLPETVKKLILDRHVKLKQQPNNKNCAEANVEPSNPVDLSKTDSELSRDFSEMKFEESKINSEDKETSSNAITFDESLEDILTAEEKKPKYLDTLLDISEEDLLYKIAIQDDETLSDSDSDDSLLNFEFASDLQEADLKKLVNNNLSLFEKQKVPALQIGSAVPDPVLSVEEAHFSKTVSCVLKAVKFHGPSCIQSVVWPAVERGRDMLIVAPPHSGKTVSYVLPIASRLTQGSNTIAEEKIEGPHSIVLCSSWRKVQAVRDCFRLFFGDAKKKIFTLYTDGGHYKNKMQSLINSSDILIATPHCLLEFFRRKLIHFSRLGEFVVDDGTTVIEKHKKELKEIILCILESMKRSECNPQFILCTERWNKNFQVIVDKVLRNPLLFFTSFLEAAIYAKIPIFAKVCSEEVTKKNALIDMIPRCKGKVVICATGAAETVEVHELLNYLNCQSYLVTEDMEHYVVDDVIESWKSSINETTSQYLVVTDKILSNMCISNADCLVHYDIPPKSRLQFGNRFSVIAEHFTSKDSSVKCSCHVLVLESDYKYAAHLVKIIENSGGTVPEELIELSKIKDKAENISSDLCHYMKAFGFCAKKNCSDRHIINSEFDKPKIVPYEGDIHGVVTHVVDASHYYIRLVKYLDPVSNKTVSLMADYAKIGFQLRDLYLSPSEELKVEIPVVGESYVLEEGNKLFYRVKILGFTTDVSTSTEKWRVLFLDEGWIKYIENPKLFKLLNQNDFPRPLAVEVYACNMSPTDSAFEWNPQTSQLVSDLIKGKDIHGKIVLCIGETLWLDPLAATVRLSDGNYVYPFKIDQKLLDCGHIIKRKHHLEFLQKACVEKITLPQITARKMKKEEVSNEREIHISYAFLDCDVYEDVYVSCVISPDQFYVQRAKFVECLDDLLDKINKQVANRKLKKAYSVFKDMVCIAPFFEDQRYYRAIVIDLLSDDEVLVFFVDFGDTGTVAKKDVYSITAEYLLLPFQAIECELAGITAVHGGWTESAANTLTKITRDEAYDMKILQLKAYSKTSSYTCGNRYVVDLWDGEKKLSEQLVQEGFGVLVESSTPVLNDILPAQVTDTIDLNDEFSSSAEDEDSDPDDKMCSAKFYGYVAKMLAEEYDLFPLPPKPNEVSEDEEEILKNCKITSLPSTSAKCDNVQKLLPKPGQINKFLSSTESSLESAKPLITWWDTPEELNILVNLRGIKIYELDITNEGFNFNTIIAGTQYSTHEEFYSKINADDAKTFHTAQGVSIVAKKCTFFKWPRLIKDKRKFFHIKYDLLHIEDDSDSEENAKPKEEKIKLPSDMRYTYDDEHSSTSDEEETYVEPWKEFAQTKDVVNELFKEI